MVRLTKKLREELKDILAIARQEMNFDNDGVIDAIYDGINMVGLNQMEDDELIRELREDVLGVNESTKVEADDVYGVIYNRIIAYTRKRPSKSVHKHVPDWSSVRQIPELKNTCEVNCKSCHYNGSIVIDVNDIQWEA